MHVMSEVILLGKKIRRYALILLYTNGNGIGDQVVQHHPQFQ
jgi:hypothetical protein